MAYRVVYRKGNKEIVVTCCWFSRNSYIAMSQIQEYLWNDAKILSISPYGE